MAAAKRAYRSPIRAEQAQLTRSAVLDAATACFVRAGFAATTVKDIADAARVSVQTVYLQGPKASILLAAVDRSIAGDDGPEPLIDRDAVRRILAARTKPEKLRLIREVVYRLPAAAPILRSFRDAAAGDPTLATAWEESERNRYADVHALVASCEALLKPDLDVDRAADIAWSVLLCPQIADLFLVGRHWTADDYVDWLIESFDRLLLR